MAYKYKHNYTYAHAYLEAFRLPVNNGESSARNRINVLTFSASPLNMKLEKKKKETININIT